MTVVNTGVINGIICGIVPGTILTGVAVAVVGDIMAEGVIEKFLIDNHSGQKMVGGVLRKDMVDTTAVAKGIHSASAGLTLGHR